jgi:hypothetical protein
MDMKVNKWQHCNMQKRQHDIEYNMVNSQARDE